MHGVFLPEDMEETGEVSSFKDSQCRYLAFVEWEGCSVATSYGEHFKQLKAFGA